MGKLDDFAAAFVACNICWCAKAGTESLRYL